MSSHVFLVHTTNLKACVARLWSLPSLINSHRSSNKINRHYTSSDINFRLPSGKSLNKLLGCRSPQLDLRPVNIHHAGLCHFHPCVDILIGISHQTHYRLLIFVCPVTPGIAAWSPCWIFISPTAEPADSCTCVIWSHFEGWQISLPTGGFGKSHTGIPVTSASCHSMNQASSVGSKV